MWGACMGVSHICFAFLLCRNNRKYSYKTTRWRSTNCIRYLFYAIKKIVFLKLFYNHTIKVCLQWQLETSPFLFSPLDVSVIVEYSERPSGSSPFAALCTCYYIKVVHSSIVGIVIKDDGWFSVSPSAHLCSIMQFNANHYDFLL